MSHCPKCKAKIGVSIRRVVFPAAPVANFAFRCGGCGIKLGYTGVSCVLALALYVAPFFLFAAIASDGAAICEVYGLVTVFVGLITYFLGIIVWGATVPALLPPAILPAEDQ